MSQPPRPPRLPPLRPPRPTAPANRALEDHERSRRLEERQSNHEVRVDNEIKAMVAYAQKREAVDRDLARGLAICARELGVSGQLPPALRDSEPPPPDAAPPKRPLAVHENARRSAQAAHGTYLTLAILVVELLLRLLSTFSQGTP